MRCPKNTTAYFALTNKTKQNKTKQNKAKQNKTQIQLNVLLKQTSMYFASKTPPCILLKQTPQNPALYFA